MYGGLGDRRTFPDRFRLGHIFLRGELKERRVLVDV